jgi:hypothetical protein
MPRVSLEEKLGYRLVLLTLPEVHLPIDMPRVSLEEKLGHRLALLRMFGVHLPINRQDDTIVPPV